RRTTRCDVRRDGPRRRAAPTGGRGARTGAGHRRVPPTRRRRSARCRRRRRAGSSEGKHVKGEERSAVTDLRRRMLVSGAALLAATAPLRLRADDSLSLALYQAVRDADSFESRNEAYDWLRRMSRRLRFQVPNPFYRLELLRLIHRESTRAGLPPELVMGVIQVES